jgi:FKBP-type peptidyl-prolyl cis-trans isomerase (trigger factor)
MKSLIERKIDGTIQLSITIPLVDIKKAKEDVINQAVTQAEFSGFRKGKAPRELVEKSLDKIKINEEVLRKLLPQAYAQSASEHQLKPIVNPKIHIDKLEDDKDWRIVALTCEMPDVQLKNYKDEIKKVTAKSKIIIPGKEKQEPLLDEVVNALLSATQVSVPNLMLEAEVDRTLSQTLDEIKRLGLTLDQYLASTGKKPEDLRAEYTKKAENDLKLEFVLQKIAESEKITIEDTEISEAIQKAKDPIEKENLEKNKYVLAGILRQQKTLDFLKNL